MLCQCSVVNSDYLQLCERTKRVRFLSPFYLKSLSDNQNFVLKSSVDCCTEVILRGVFVVAFKLIAT